MTKLTNSAPAREGQPYESPALEIIDIEIEGTVCVGSPNGVPDPSDAGEWFM